MKSLLAALKNEFNLLTKRIRSSLSPSTFINFLFLIILFGTIAYLSTIKKQLLETNQNTGIDDIKIEERSTEVIEVKTDIAETTPKEEPPQNSIEKEPKIAPLIEKIEKEEKVVKNNRPKKTTRPFKSLVKAKEKEIGVDFLDNEKTRLDYLKESSRVP